MADCAHLSVPEFRSLQEIGKGVLHGNIPEEHEGTLIRHGYAYKLLGHIRITKSGRARLTMGQECRCQRSPLENLRARERMWLLRLQMQTADADADAVSAKSATAIAQTSAQQGSQRLAVRTCGKKPV